MFVVNLTCILFFSLKLVVCLLLLLHIIKCTVKTFTMEVNIMDPNRGKRAYKSTLSFSRCECGTKFGFLASPISQLI